MLWEEMDRVKKELEEQVYSHVDRIDDLGTSFDKVKE